MSGDLDELLRATNVEITRLQHLGEVAGRVRAFAGGLVAMGLQVSVAHHGAGRFVVDIHAPRAEAARDPKRVEAVPDLHGAPLSQSGFVPNMLEITDCDRLLMANLSASVLAEDLLRECEMLAGVPGEAAGLPGVVGAVVDQTAADEVAPVALGPGAEEVACLPEQLLPPPVGQAPVEPLSPALNRRVVGLWSADEDAQAVRLKRAGCTVGEIASALGRSNQAVSIRVYTTLRGRLREPTPEGLAPAHEGAAPLTGEDAVVTCPAALRPIDALASHLTGLPRANGWSIDRDIELLDLALLGWPEFEVALEVGVTSRDLKDRFDLLTNKRMFKRDAVLGGLRALAGSAGAP